MKTITISYDNSNIVVEKLLECIVCAGAQILNNQTSTPNAIDGVILEIQNGQTTTCANFDDFLSKINS